HLANAAAGTQAPVTGAERPQGHQRADSEVLSDAAACPQTQAPGALIDDCPVETCFGPCIEGARRDSTIRIGDADADDGMRCFALTWMPALVGIAARCNGRAGLAKRGQMLLARVLRRFACREPGTLQKSHLTP